MQCTKVRYKWQSPFAICIGVVPRKLLERPGKAPARIVRVNTGVLDGVLKAKSRMVIPGHLDPHLGEYRSDAPTTAWVAVQMAKCIATSRRWRAFPVRKRGEKGGVHPCTCGWTASMPTA